MRQGYVKMTPVRQGVNPFGYPAHPKDKKQMAFYHCSVKAVQRSKGQTATRCAAYRAGELIHCERTGETHDYRRKTGVMHTEIITPNDIHTPTREQLWNMAELAEKRKDSCVAREYEVALPHELTHDQRTALAQEFCKHIASSYGVAVDLCIHRPTDKEVAKGADPRNFHAHILTTTRVITDNGLGAKADNEKAGRNRKKDLESIRIAWQDFANEHLAKAGLDERIDHRSHKERGLDIAPTQKMGVSATAMERKGIRTEKGDINRAIKRANAELLELQTELEWVYDDAVDADLLNEIHPSALAPAKPPATATDAPPAPAPKWVKPARPTSKRHARTIIVDDEFVPPPAPKVVESVRDSWQDYSPEYALHGAFSPRYNGNPLSNEMLALELKKQAGMSQDDYQHQRKVFETVAIDNAKRLVSNQGKYNEHEYKERERTAMMLLDLSNSNQSMPAKPDPAEQAKTVTNRDDYDFNL